MDRFRIFSADMGASYFSEKYISKHADWPKQCAKCKKVFGDKKKDSSPENEYSVKDGPGIYVCPNAASRKCDCCYALCGRCALGELPAKRPRQGKNVFPTEVDNGGLSFGFCMP